MAASDLLAYYNEMADLLSAEGLDTSDPRLIAAVKSVEKMDWADLLQRLEDLHAERVYDVRVFAFSMYLAWRDGGLAAVPGIQAASLKAVGHNLEKFGPARKREAHMDARLGWAFATMNDDVVYHEKRKTPEWTTWSRGLVEATISEVTSTRSALYAELGKRNFTRCSEGLARFSQTFEQHASAFRLVANQAKEKAAEADAKKAAEATSARSFSDKTKLVPSGTTREETMSIEPRSRSEVSAGTQHLDLKVSPAFVELCHKLQAFESLIEKRKFLKAALVADDLTSVVSNFDPRTYFPDLFADFGKLLAENVEVLAEHWTQRDTLSWKALEQYYRVDLQRFVDG